MFFCRKKTSPTVSELLKQQTESTSTPVHVSHSNGNILDLDSPSTNEDDSQVMENFCNYAPLNGICGHLVFFLSGLCCCRGHSCFTNTPVLLCCLRSIVTHRDHFVRRLSVCLPGTCISHTFLVVRHSYVLQATHAFLGMLPLVLVVKVTLSLLAVSLSVRLSASHASVSGLSSVVLWILFH